MSTFGSNERNVVMPFAAMTCYQLPCLMRRLWRQCQSCILKYATFERDTEISLGLISLSLSNVMYSVYISVFCLYLVVTCWKRVDLLVTLSLSHWYPGSGGA